MMGDFVMMVGAYVVAWLLCNVFLYQVVNRIDSNYRKRMRTEMADEVATLVVDKLRDEREKP